MYIAPSLRVVESEVAFGLYAFLDFAISFFLNLVLVLLLYDLRYLLYAGTFSGFSEAI
jgi:hypothetical protein